MEPHYGPGRYLTFEGFSVDEHGKQHYLDATVAYRQTTLRCIEYLRRFGYNDYQVYLLLSCAPVQGHIAGLVDVRLPSSPGELTDFRNFVDAYIIFTFRFQMLAQPSVFQWTFLISTSARLGQRRRWTWGAVPSRASNLRRLEKEPLCVGENPPKHQLFETSI